MLDLCAPHLRTDAHYAERRLRGTPNAVHLPDRYAGQCLINQHLRAAFVYEVESLLPIDMLLVSTIL